MRLACLLLATWTVSAGCLWAEPLSTAPAVGLRQETPGWFALVGARVVTEPGKVLDGATLVIRDGRIVSVGAGVEVPAGAKRIDLKGKTVYAGFVESYTGVKIEGAPEGPGHWNPQVTPHRRAAAAFKPDAKLDKTLRSQGFAARLVAPSSGVIKGTSCVALTNSEAASKSLLAERVATHVSLTVPFNENNNKYPNSPMGAVALARQAMLDAGWHRDATRAFESTSTGERPETNRALEELASNLDGGRQLIADTSNELFALRADRFASEFSLRLAIRGSGKEYRRLDEIAATGRSVIVPVKFPKPPKVASPDTAADVTLEELMHWHLAPENPGRLVKAGVAIALTSSGLKKRGDFLAKCRQAIERGLPADNALEALTTAPARLLGLDHLLGAIEPGKIANLVVSDGDLFTAEGRVLSTWVAGQEFEVEPDDAPLLVGDWSLQTLGAEAPTEPLSLVVSVDDGKESAVLKKAESAGADDPEDADEDDDEAVPSSFPIKELRLEHARLTGRLDGDLLGVEGTVLLSANATPTEDDSTLAGVIQPITGKPIAFTAVRVDSSVTSENNEDEADEDSTAEPLNVAVNYPLGAYGREAEPKQPDAVLFRGATVWTSDAAGVLEHADVLVRSGQITEVSVRIEAPEGAVAIDAAGKHLTAGLIDCHSHMATDGGLNEWTQAITAEVRVADFIDPDDITIYRQLAGGLTTANVLHGSANPIGGQNQVIKLRWGAGMDELRFPEAPAGIKFALGENVKQSNWGDKHTTRYPQTRMGVDEITINAFLAAKQYAAEQAAWRRQPVGAPPRRDLELEALAEVLAGERWIHCHSYRQSEVLTFLRTLERFEVTVGTLQHILEGYKVAPEMAAHGAMGSTFADWWAYKFEVLDAIPYNGSLMHRAGICVSFNSDDNELGRHLNHEAAKAVKYGGTSPEEALKFVTLNPAKQLRIDHLVGSITEGKHADLALWSGPPLALTSVCEQTWIDGRKYFDRGDDRRQRAEQGKLRWKLVQAVIDSGEPAAKPGENPVDPATLWPRHDEFCHGHGHEDHHH